MIEPHPRALWENPRRRASWTRIWLTWAFVGLLGTLAWGTALLAAQEPGKLPESSQGSSQGTGDEIFFDAVEVNVVNVEVFVTDRKGNPIRGLEKEDFLLYEDGQPVAITNFVAIEDGALAPEEDDAASGSEKAPRTGPPRLTNLPVDQRLHVVIFIDNLNLEPGSRNRALDHLRRFLRESLGPQDRVMLVSFNGTLEIEQGFTSLPEILQPLIDQMQDRSGQGQEVTAARDYIFRDIQGVSLVDENAARSVFRAEAERIYEAIRIHAQEISNRTRLTLKTLERLSDSLAGLPGRKALLYVSGGLSRRPGEVLMEAWFNKFQSVGQQLNIGNAILDTQDFDTSDEFQELIARASANRVVIYTIDAVGHRSFGAVSAEISGGDVSGISSSDGGRAFTPEVSSRLNANLQDSLQFLAEGSGGLSFVNTRALGKNLGQLANDFKTYYSLGYSPDRKADGRYHRLTVEVPGGKYRIRHRSGFRDKTSSQEMGEKTLSALLLNVSDNPLAIAVERGQEKGTSRNRYEVPLLVKIPIGRLALLPEEKLHRGRVSVFIAVADADGGRSQVQERLLPVDIPAEKVNEALSQFIGHAMTLQMREGFHRLAVGVRDDVAGTSSTVRFNVRIGA